MLEVGGWVGGWVGDRKVVCFSSFGMSCWRLWEGGLNEVLEAMGEWVVKLFFSFGWAGGWVGGWVGGRTGGLTCAWTFHPGGGVVCWWWSTCPAIGGRRGKG